MLISDLPIVILRNLIITIFLEIIIAYILGYRKKDLINVLLVNILTNPLLNCITVSVNFYFGILMRNIVLIILEIIVLIIEGIIYQKYLDRKKINGYLLSFILNTSSFFIGMIINKIIY